MFGGAYYSVQPKLLFFDCPENAGCMLLHLLFPIYPSTWCHILEDRNAPQHCCNNLTSQVWVFFRTLLEENLYQKAVQFQDVTHWKFQNGTKKNWSELNCYKICHCEMYFDHRLETAPANFSQVHSSIKTLAIQSWYVTVHRKYSIEGEK